MIVHADDSAVGVLRDAQHADDPVVGVLRDAHDLWVPKVPHNVYGTFRRSGGASHAPPWT